MPSLPAPTSTPAWRSSCRQGLARWWLAGFLVSCLLPVSLSSTGAAGGSERTACICLWAPAVLRARFARIAVRRRCRSLARRKGGAARQRAPLLALALVAPRLAAFDVRTSRGPPHPL